MRIIELEFSTLATNVWKRHHLLEETIGYLPLEQQSYENITTLLYMAVVLVPVLTILELTLYLLYQFKVSQQCLFQLSF